MSKSSSLFLSFAGLALVAAAVLVYFQPFAVQSANAQAKVVEKPATSEVTAKIASDIKASLETGRPGLSIGAISGSKIPGLYKVSINNGPTLYATADGSHFVLGDLYQVANGQFVNIAEQEREGGRAEMMAAIKPADMVVFAPKQQPAKAVINVFTDVDCYYCQKLHQEVPDLNRMGIEVRYLAFPRAGIGSGSYKKIASAWCAKDKQTALTRLKNRQTIPTNVCTPNPIAGQLDLGRRVGVTGTPAMVTSGGKLMPGYVPALRLAGNLGVAVDPALAAEINQRSTATQ